MSKCDFCAATEGIRPLRIHLRENLYVCEDANACHIRTYGTPLNTIATHFEGDAVIVTTTKGYDVQQVTFPNHEAYKKHRGY